MGCQILREKDTKEITAVLTLTGENSNLFNELVQEEGNKETALRRWVQAYTDSFKAWSLKDTEEEPTLAELKNYESRLTEHLGNEIIYYGNNTKGTLDTVISESNEIFTHQLSKLKEATHGTLQEGKVVSRETVKTIIDNIVAKSPRNDYDHLGFDHTTGILKFYNRLSPEANERARRAVQLLEDLTTRTGLPYKIDFYLETPGEFRDGVAVVNPYHPRYETDIVWHEALGHPIVEAIFQQAENSDLYKSLKGQIDENVGGIKEFMEDNYPEYPANSEDYYKEAITTLLGRYMDFVNKTVDKFQVNQEIGLGAAIVKFLDRFLARVKNVLNDIISNYNSSTKRLSIEDLKDKKLTIQELATILGSTQNFLELSDVKFTSKYYAKTATTISPLEQAVLNAQTQRVTKTLDEQLQSARQQAAKQFRILRNKVTPTQSQTLQRLLNYLEDPETYGKIRTFAAYLSETSSMLNYYFNEGVELSKVESENADKISQLRFILQVAESYEPIIRSLEDEYIFVDQENEVKKLIESSKGMINQVKVLYRREIEDPLVKELASNVDVAATDITTQLNGEIDYLKDRLTTATVGTSRHTSLQSQIATLEAQKDKLIPNTDNIRSTLRGERGDTNLLSMWFEAPIAGGDMIISSFAKKMKDMFNNVRRRLIPLKNTAQEQVDSYTQATGRNIHNSRDYYEGLYEPVKRGHMNHDTNELAIEEYYSLLGEFDQQYILDHQVWIKDLNELKKAGDMPAYRAKQREYEDWRNKYMERQYTESYYAAEKLLTDDAKEAQQALLNQIAIQKDLVRSNQGSLDDSEALDDLWIQYTDLGRTYDRTGQKKTGQDLAIATSIQAFRAARREMESFQLTPEGQANYNSELQRQKDKLTSGYITQEDLDKWVRKNTTRRIDPQFYEDRRKITKRISDILAKIPPEIIGKESTDELWESVFAIAGNHRDEDRVTDGSDISSEELSRVRESQDKLEVIRQKATSLGGLSPIESEELSSLFNLEPSERDDETHDRINELMTKKKNTKAEILKYISPAELLLLNQSFDELGQIQNTKTTKYYDNAYKENYNVWASQRPEIQANSALYDTPLMHQAFEQSDWFKENHIYKSKPQFTDGKFDGYLDIPEPLYVWRDVLPANEKLIDWNYPAFKYLDRIVKPEYINNNYKDSIDGYNTPKRTVEEDGRLIPSKYLNAKYETLKSDNNPKAKAQFSMLQFLTNTYLEGQAKLPMEKRMGLLLPAIEKETHDRFQDSKGIKSAATQQWNNFKRNWTLTEQDSDVALGDVAGMEFNYIPVKYTGRISTDDVSLNLMESVMKHRYMSEQYEVLEQTQALSYALQVSVDDDSNKIATGKIDAFLKKLGFNVKVLSSGQSSRSKQLNEFIKTIWYGELQKDEHLLGLSINKITNNIMGISALQMLALNIPAHITNLISGEVQQFIEASANKYFSKSDYFSAKRKYATHVVDFWQDYRKEGKKSLMGQMVDLFDVMQGEFEDEFGAKTNYSNIKEGRGWLFFTKNAGEHEIQVSTFIAMATNKMIKQGDNMIRLIDAYELGQDGNIKLKDDVEFTDDQFHNFTGKVHSLLKDLNGNYNKFDRPLIEKHSVGRLFSFMRKFMVPMIARRFEGTRADLEMGEVQEGYYRAFARTFGKDLLKYRFDIIARWGDLTDREKQAVQRTLSELAIITVFIALIAVLGGYDDDRKLRDEKMASWGFWKNHLLYQAMKVKSETENFLPLPGLGFDEAIRTGTTTTVAWRSLAQLASVTAELGNLATGSDKAYYKTNTGIWNTGDMKLTAKLGKMLGFTGNILHPEILIKNFELGQKVK